MISKDCERMCPWQKPRLKTGLNHDNSLAIEKWCGCAEQHIISEYSSVVAMASDVVHKTFPAGNSLASHRAQDRLCSTGDVTCKPDNHVTCRVHVAQVLRVSCPDMITLDCGKITGRGITMGSSFQVPQLADAHACFGPTPATQACPATQDCCPKPETCI